MKLKISSALLTLLLAGTVHAAPTGVSFLKINPSPRSYSLANSNVASSLGSEGAYLNPSNVGSLDRRYELFTSFSSMLDGAQFSHVGLGINRNTTQSHLIDGLGFSYTRMGVGDLEGRDRSGQKSGSFTSQNSVFALNASAGLTSRLRLGATGKLLQSEIAGYKSNRSLAMDMGMSYSVKLFGKESSLAATVTNLGQKVGFISQKDPLPASLSVGAALNFGVIQALGSVSRGMYDQKTVLHLGMETNLGAVSLRAGYKSDTGVGSGISGQGAAGLLGGLTTGMGLKIKGFRLDYALGQEAAELGLSHRASLSFQFGKRAQ